MSQNVYSSSEIREVITRLPEQFEKEPEVITVTQHGKPIMAIHPWDLYESIIETLEVLGDPELMTAIRQGEQDIADGRGKLWEEVKKELGLE